MISAVDGSRIAAIAIQSNEFTHAVNLFELKKAAAEEARDACYDQLQIAGDYVTTNDESVLDICVQADEVFQDEINPTNNLTGMVSTVANQIARASEFVETVTDYSNEVNNFYDQIVTLYEQKQASSANCANTDDPGVTSY